MIGAIFMLPVHIEVEDVTVRRNDVDNEVKITLFDLQIPGDKRLPLFEFFCSRREMQRVFNEEGGTSCSGTLERGTTLGKIRSS